MSQYENGGQVKDMERVGGTLFFTSDMKEEYEVTCGGRSEGKIGIGRGFYGSGVGLCIGGSDHPQSRLQRTHFFGDGFPDAFNQDASDRVPDKILAGYPDDFTCRFGDGERAYQFFLLFA